MRPGEPLSVRHRRREVWAAVLLDAAGASSALHRHEASLGALRPEVPSSVELPSAALRSTVRSELASSWGPRPAFPADACRPIFRRD